LANNGRQETKELAEVQEEVQRCMKPMTIKFNSIQIRPKMYSQLFKYNQIDISTELSQNERGTID